MSKIHEIIEELQKFSSDILEWNPPIKNAFIRSFETRFWLTLPSDYKELLRHTNGFSLMGVGVIGISPNQKTYGLESLYIIEHNEVGNPQPEYLVPFHNDGAGNHYCFDTREISGDSCKIVFWQHDIDYTHDEPEVVHDSFSDWIKEVVIDWTLEEYNYDGSDK